MNLTKKFKFIICLIFLFCNSTTTVFPQQEPRKFIVVELIIKKEYFNQTVKIPISENPFEKNGVYLKNGEFYAAGLITVHCDKCLLTREYDIFGLAISKNENSADITLNINFKNEPKCKIEKEFLNKKKEKFKFKSKCGVQVVAYYENDKNN